MPNIEVRGKYRTFRYDGTTPLDFTPYNNSIFLIRRPNPTTFVTLQQYVPGQGGAFTTFDPGSSYTIVTNADGSQDFNFNMGPYTRVDRLPSSTLIKTPNFYIGLDKNSIAVPISSYALSVNSPLSSVVNILYQNGQGNRLQYVAADSFRTGAPVNFTHFLPNSGYELRNRVPYTFFAPLKSEMGDAYAIGNNSGGEFGMGHRYSPFTGAPNTNNYFIGLSVIAEQTYGIWDKIVTSNYYEMVNESGQIIHATSFAALSACGSGKVIFVLGQNLYGQLGTGSDKQYYATWTKIPGVWNDVEMGSRHMLATNSSGHLYACGSNLSGQLGLGSDTLSANTLTLVDNSRNYIELAPGGTSTIVRDSLGRIWGCGYNGYGILGLNSTSSPVFTLTQEATNSTWTKVRYGWGGYVVALKENKLFGAGAGPYYYGAGGGSQKNIFTQEILGLTDIVDFYISTFGTYIKRIGQGSLYASGINKSVNGASCLAALSGTSITSFTITAIPSDITKIISIYGQGTIGYIRYNRLYGRTNPKTFQIIPDLNVFDVYPEYSIYNTIFLLKDGNIRPTPTPTPTITLTPSPVPFQPLNVSQIGIFASEQRSSNDTINTNSYVNGIPGALNNALTQTFFLKGPSSGILNHAYDYEKGNEYNRVVGVGFDGQDFNNNYPRYLYYHGGPYTKMSTQFNRGRNSDYYGFDALMITPSDSAGQQGIYLYAYFKYASTLPKLTGEYRLAISYDRGVTWPINETLYGMRNSVNEIAYYDVANGATCRPVFSMSRQRTATSRFDVRVLFNANFVYNIGDLYSSWPRGLVCKIAYPTGTGSLETVYNQMGEAGPTYTPIGYTFNHDYFNIPTAVSIGYDSVIQNNKILIHRRINNTWITDTVLSNISDACNRSNGTYSNRLGNNKNLISIEFNPTNPEIIYIAYILKSSSPPGYLFVPRRINVITYNMQTKTLIQNQKVISSIAGDPGYARITAVSNFAIPVDMPTLFYDKIAQKLYLYCYVAMIDNEFRSYDTVFKTSTSDNTNWSALVQFNPDCQSVGVCHGTFGSNWDLKVKY